MGQLTEHFSLEELTVTSEPFDNTPSPEMVERLDTLAIFGEKVRIELDSKPMIINSAYRSPAVNEAVGGVPTSAHAEAYAMDFTCPEFGTPYEVALRLAEAGSAGRIVFDQLIYEDTWVHISRDPQARGQRLTKTDTGYIEGIVGP